MRTESGTVAEYIYCIVYIGGIYILYIGLALKRSVISANYLVKANL